MGIGLEIHSSRPVWGRSSTGTQLPGLYRHGDALGQALSELERNGLGRPGWVDLYMGDS
jgi:hypothetical protein